MAKMKINANQNPNIRAFNNASDFANKKRGIGTTDGVKKRNRDNNKDEEENSNGDRQIELKT